MLVTIGNQGHVCSQQSHKEVDEKLTTTVIHAGKSGGLREIQVTIRSRMKSDIGRDMVDILLNSN